MPEMLACAAVKCFIAADKAVCLVLPNKATIRQISAYGANIAASATVKIGGVSRMGPPG